MTRRDATVVAALLAGVVALTSTAIAHDPAQGTEPGTASAALEPDDSWLSCDRDEQCVLLPAPCGGRVAVNLDHRELMQQHVAHIGTLIDCMWPPPAEPPSRAACAAHVCSVVPTAP